MRYLEPVTTVRVGSVPVLCEVARTAQDQARGLQGVHALADGEGMLFPFHPPRATTFHMGSVAFPIDLLFADASGRIARIVHAAAPGSRSRWGHPVAGAVVELAGGYAARAGMTVGDVVLVAGERLASWVRRGSVIEADLSTLIPQVLAAAIAHGIDWEPTVLNTHRDRAVVTPMVVGHWLHDLPLGDDERGVVHDVVTSKQGLDALGTAMISEQMADDAHVVPLGSDNVLVLTRRK